MHALTIAWVCSPKHICQKLNSKSYSVGRWVWRTCLGYEDFAILSGLVLVIEGHEFESTLLLAVSYPLPFTMGYCSTKSLMRYHDCTLGLSSLQAMSRVDLCRSPRLWNSAVAHHMHKEGMYKVTIHRRRKRTYQASGILSGVLSTCFQMTNLSNLWFLEI